MIKCLALVVWGVLLFAEPAFALDGQGDASFDPGEYDSQPVPQRNPEASGSVGNSNPASHLSIQSSPRPQQKPFHVHWSGIAPPDNADAVLNGFAYGGVGGSLPGLVLDGNAVFTPCCLSWGDWCEEEIGPVLEDQRGNEPGAYLLDGEIHMSGDCWRDIYCRQAAVSSSDANRGKDAPETGESADPDVLRLIRRCVWCAAALISIEQFFYGPGPIQQNRMSVYTGLLVFALHLGPGLLWEYVWERHLGSRPSRWCNLSDGLRS